MILHRGTALAALLALLTFSGCSSGRTGDADGASGEPAGTTGAGTTSAQPSAAPEGFPVLPVEARQQARLRIIGGPDWIAADAHGVWVKRDSGQVDLIDPDTDEVTASVEVDVGGQLCQGIGAGLGAVWTCAGSDIVRIDPESRMVTARHSVGKAFSQGHLATGGGRLWVLTGDGSTLVGIEPTTGAVATTVPLGVRGADLAFGDAGLWVVSTLDDQVVRVDPDRAEVTLRVPDLQSPVSLAVTDQLWVGTMSGTLRLDPATGDVLATAPIGTGRDGGVAVADDAVWVRSAERFLVRLDPTDARPVEGFSSDTPSGGDLTVAFGSLWTSAFDDATVFRLPAGAS